MRLSAEDPISGTSVGSFDLVTPRRVVFGWGRRAELEDLIPSRVGRLLVVTGATTPERDPRVASLLDQLRISREVILLARIGREPLVEDVDRATSEIVRLRPSQRDAVLAVGGGSAIDLGKAVAAMATNRHAPSVQSFLEGVGTGAQLEHAPLPFIAVPTTAGTGSEATMNAVISSLAPPFKKSLRSPAMMAELALVDPELTSTCPPGVTAASGMDAITQLIESYICVRSTPITRALCLEGMRGAIVAIRQAVCDGESRGARERMALAALLSGVSLANSGLGMAHGVAAALGVHCGVSHGLACALMLPVAIDINRRGATALLAGAASVLLERPFSTADDAIDELRRELDKLYGDLGLPRRLNAVGVAREQMPAIARDSFGNSMSGNPVSLTPEQLDEILQSQY